MGQASGRAGIRNTARNKLFRYLIVSFEFRSEKCHLTELIIRCFPACW